MTITIEIIIIKEVDYSSKMVTHKDDDVYDGDNPSDSTLTQRVPQGRVRSPTELVIMARTHRRALTSVLSGDRVACPRQAVHTVAAVH